MKRLKGHAAEFIYTLPVTDDQLCFVGSINLEDLVLAKTSDYIEDIMDKEARSVNVYEDQETAARLLQASDVLALPVVDAEGRLVGMITVDDAIDILEFEEAEDLMRTGGSEPLGRPYFSVSIARMVKNRAIWLFILAFAATMTVSVLNTFQDVLQNVISLSLFIPLLIGVGGNCGAQSATTVVRSMAIGEIRREDFKRVVLREGSVGFLLGAVLGGMGFFPINGWWVLRLLSQSL